MKDREGGAPARLAALVLAGTAVAAGPAGAQTNPDEGGTELEPVVVSTTRVDTPVSDLTRSVTRIDREQLQQQSRLERNLGDILGSQVPGMATGFQGLSNFSQTLRGRNFQTLLDGVPQNAPLRATSRHLNTASVETIERVEVIRGGTAVYGFGATGGLVNLITRRPEKGAFNANSSAGISFSTQHPDDSFQYTTSHGISGRSGQVDYVLQGNFAKRESFFDADGDRIPPDPFANQGGLAESDEYDIFGKLGYTFGGGEQRIELMANRFELKQSPDFTFANGDPAENEEAEAVPGSINTVDPGNEITTIATTYTNDEILGSSLKAKVYYNDTSFIFPKFPGFTQTKVESEKFGSRTTVETPFALAGVDATAVWGVDFLYDETTQPGIDGPTTVPEMEQASVAAFGELEVPVGSWGRIRAGLRQEHIGVDIASVTNRLGRDIDAGDLTFNETLVNVSGVAFVSRRVEVFGSFSQGFAVNDIGRLVQNNQTIDGAGELSDEAEKVDNFELGVRGRTRTAEASVAAFYSSSDNGRTFDQDLNLVTQPERIWGVEATADYDPTRRWGVGGTVTWLEGEVDTDDDDSFESDLPTTRIPPLKLTAHAEYSPVRWWDMRLQGLFSGDRTSDGTGFGHGPVNDFTVLNLVSAFDTGFGQIDVAVSNLLNNDFFPVSSQASGRAPSNRPSTFTKAPGRRVSLTYSVEW
ncbi:iron complex outermembrane recepter protein [Limimonas halophila]|uniref:Iron complex outermembrane recepter protein n=1 Tax=Limimonas halophila TaxID=1082479 RepID=A0A1G7PRW3_9PROT|nr:TonB-dependent receptor [Limimonas halophila]SDF88978.1 iron complex outermembrane recepter protein [Limimonas halophila]